MNRVTAPRVKMKVGSWELGLLASVSEGGRAPPQREFCVIANSFIFLIVALGMAAKA